MTTFPNFRRLMKGVIVGVDTLNPLASGGRKWRQAPFPGSRSSAMVRRGERRFEKEGLSPMSRSSSPTPRGLLQGGTGEPVKRRGWSHFIDATAMGDDRNRHDEVGCVHYAD